MRRYLLGLLAAQAGDEAGAARLVMELERAASPPSDSLLGQHLAAAVRAEVSRLNGDVEGALTHLERIVDRPTYQLVLPSPFEPRVRERFVRATLLEQLGRTAESRTLLDGIGARSLYDLPYARAR
jgi:hypothetical protein